MHDHLNMVNSTPAMSPWRSPGKRWVRCMKAASAQHLIYPARHLPFCFRYKYY